MKRRTLVTSVVAVFALSAIWYVFLWSPQSASLKQSRASAAAAVQKEASLSAQVAALKLKQGKLPADLAQLALLATAVPALPAADKLIDDVNALSKTTGVFLTTFSPTQPVVSATGTSGPSAMNVSLSVTGPYQQLLNFIAQFTAMPRLAVIDSIAFSGGANGTSMSAAIVGRVFVAPAPAVGGAAGATTTTTVAGH